MILQHWKQAAVTLQGVEHISKEIPCQDKIGYYFDSNIRVIALADGAGSRKKAEYGAKAAVSSTCKYLGKEFYNLYMMCEETGKTVEKQKSDTENAKLLIISNAIKSITDIVEENCVIEDYASTLLFFACDGNKYICGHIGDGVIGVLDKKNELNLTVISETENGGAPNITFFITDNNAIEHFRLSCGDMSDVQGVLLMSDGPEEVLYETNTKFNPNA
ncbi:MAG: PP2C family serine/threonine-protein phosphatase, partial [Clostridia bacterium]